MSDSVQPHRRQPTRLSRPWDSPGKITGVGCHFLLQCMKVESESRKSLGHVRLSPTPWTAAREAPPSLGFSRQEYWSGLPVITWHSSLKETFFFFFPWKRSTFTLNFPCLIYEILHFPHDIWPLYRGKCLLYCELNGLFASEISQFLGIFNVQGNKMCVWCLLVKVL